MSQSTAVTAGGRNRRSTAALVASRWQTLAPFVVLVALIVVFGVLQPIFLTVDNSRNILTSSSVLLVLALGTTAVMLTGSIDLSVGSTLTLSAYAAALLAQHHGTGMLLLAPLVGLACGVLNGVLVAYGRLPSFLVTLGGYFAYDGVASYISDGQPVGLPLGGISSYFGGVKGNVPIIFVWAVVVLIAIALVFRYTAFGRYLYAVGGNERTARLSGVRVERVKLYAFMLSGFLAGVAALLQVVRTQSASPSMGSAFLLLAIGSVVMGGTSLSGGSGGAANSIMGVLVIAILSNGMVLASVDPYIQNVVIGVVVVAAVAITMKRSRDDVIK
jgi:ribose transport system permease protein